MRLAVRFLISTAFVLVCALSTAQEEGSDILTDTADEATAATAAPAAEVNEDTAGAEAAASAATSEPALTTAEGELSPAARRRVEVARLEEILTEYNSGGELRFDEAREIAEGIRGRLEGLRGTPEYPADLVAYIDACTVISYLYATGAFAQHWAYVEPLEKELETLVKNSRPRSGEVYLSYADFLFSEISWKWRASFAIINKLPVWYRRASLYEKSADEARLKLAIWYISAANAYTPRWNAFIREQERRLRILSPMDCLNAYVGYAMFYMKTHNTEKGIYYLEEAEKLYPGNYFVAMVRSNFEKGRFAYY